MKRVKAACICQTLHFTLKEDLGLGLAQRRVQEEMEHYKKGLDRSGTKYKIVEELPQSGTKYKIVEELPQSDGSVILKIIKQYNQSPVGDYLK